MTFEPTPDAIPAVPGLNGQPRKRPSKLLAGCDFARCRRYLRRRGFKARIARRGVESSEQPGRHRWAVERTHAWFAGFGKLHIRVERCRDIRLALLFLVAAESARDSWKTRVGGCYRASAIDAAPGLMVNVGSRSANGHGQRLMSKIASETRPAARAATVLLETSRQREAAPSPSDDPRQPTEFRPLPLV